MVSPFCPSCPFSLDPLFFSKEERIYHSRTGTLYTLTLLSGKKNEGTKHYEQIKIVESGRHRSGREASLRGERVVVVLVVFLVLVFFGLFFFVLFFFFL